MRAGTSRRSGTQVAPALVEPACNTGLPLFRMIDQALQNKPDRRLPDGVSRHSHGERVPTTRARFSAVGGHAARYGLISGKHSTLKFISKGVNEDRVCRQTHAA